MEKLKLLALILAIRIPAAGHEAYTLYNTQVRTLRSKHGGVDYKLYISLPRNYEKKSEAYPVVLILDPDYFFGAVHHAAVILADHDELQPMILVGIAYPGGIEGGRGDIFKLNRTRDHTPTRVASGGYGPEFQKRSGGADRHLDFMAQELIPYLEENFRVKPDDRALVGISYGGLFATYALLTRPHLFQRFIIVSPSLWWDKHMMSRLEQKVAGSTKDLPARVFFSVGARETRAAIGEEMVKDLVSFATKLKSRNYPHLQFKLWIAPEETHHSVFPGSAMRGIQWIFSRNP